FEPLNIIAGYLPLIIVVPLSFAWFAPLGGDWQKILFLAIACFVYMLPLIVKAVDEVDEMFLNTAQTLGARGVALVTRVLFPIALPDIYNTIRLAFGVGWTWILVGEGLGADPESGGLGYVFNAAYRYNKELMYIPAFIILAVGFCADRVLEYAGRFLFPYRYV
ncbi:MAG: ABC transporter permease subunit, partial [Candidatus Eremiobacterota bacterium]